MGAVPMISAMMQRGLQVDLSHFAKMEKVLIDDMNRITEEVKTMTGVYCNLDSGDQVSTLLFKTLGLKQARRKFTKSGDRESVENEVLVAIQHDHPVVPKILNFKELSKLKGTYVTPMPSLARRTKFGTWRMYPNLGHTRIPSGRLNCKEPNLLAMPNRTARGREICEGFITDPGWVYLSVDESQIEPRVVAHRSADAQLRAIYFNEEDIYSDFAIGAFRLPDTRYQDDGGWHYPGVDKKTHRFPSKTCILAAIYDVTNIGLLEQMPTVCKNCGKEATLHDCHQFEALWNESNCQDILNTFYLRYPSILSMRKQDHQRARRYGYLWDEWGRILHITAVRSVLEWVVSSALREAGNFPIQSTAQGTVKLVMAEVWDDFEAMGLLDVCHPLLQIHDELLFECREDVAEEVAAHVRSRFEHCVRLEVPIRASSATSLSWGTLPK
jgi:DNA polymerase-1